MRLAIQITDPREAEVTVTIRAPLKDFLALRELLPPDKWPASDLAREIGSLAFKLQRSLEPSKED